MTEQTLLNAFTQNEMDRATLRRVAADLRHFLAPRGIVLDDPEARSLLSDVEALERVASWIGNRVVLGGAS